MPEQDKKTFIICDDFGLSRGIDNAILELLEMEYSSGTSVLFSKLTDESFTQKLKVLSDKDPKIKLGLHLNFTIEGKYVEQIDLTHYFKLFYSRTYRNKVSNSIKDQIQYFEKIFHRRPDHIDSHKHLHQLPLLRNLLITTLKTFSYGDISIRNTFIPLKIAIKHYKLFTIKEIINICWFNLIGKSFKFKLIRNGLQTNSNFLGYYDLHKEINPLEKWMSYSEIINEKSLFIIHPGYEDSSILKYDPINSQRLNELKAIENFKR